ncbi:hypothetical protein [Listeria seeligeri]|uniref:hypothetical protein n=1 Tax=Listeria seeligeri TaxID=1640 RepID=UPI001628979F|nr:hypothetical protein [Listeria seeligeri]MBC1723115.1 hypothetical protein [Listeria seeligeri]MBF2346243.1 hypothetical protein [Listeria seeligeri]MBF2436975.1 hypothetical protein [Listeria seeligeri]
MDSYIITISEWLGTSVVLKLEEQQKAELIKLLNFSEEEFWYCLDKLEIFNHKNKLFLEEQFITSSFLEFEVFLDKYKDKDFSKLYYFSQVTRNFSSFPPKLGSDKIVYSESLEGNNIITNGISEEKFAVPPGFFNEIKLKNDNYDELEKKALNYLAELFSLFMIADKSKVYMDDSETYFEFTIFCKNKEHHVLNVKWKDWEYFKGDLFYSCYNWILCRSEEKFKVSTLLQVVRQYFENLSSIKNLENITISLDSIMNRIIKNETKEYFKQQNKLKDEFLVYEKMEMDSNRLLMTSLLGLITTIGLAYYGKVILIKDFSFTDKNNGLAIIFIFALIATLFFSFTYYLGFVARKKYYKSLKKIYLDKFAFAESDFESYLSKPALFKGHKVYWITLLLFAMILCGAIYICG